MSQVTRDQERVTIRPQCDIVASMAQEFRDELKSILVEEPRELLIDLEGVEMVDSVGLGVFIAAYNSMSKAGGQLTLCSVSRDIFTLLKTMRLDQRFTVHVSEEETCHG